MAYLQQSNVTQSQLVAGIIGTIDIGNLVGQSITLQDDINRATGRMNEINAALQGLMKTATDEAVTLAKTDGLSIVSKAKLILPQNLSNIDVLLRDMAIQSAGGYKISATILSQYAKLWSSFQHTDLYSKALLDIPESHAVNKLLHYYNKLLAPNHPSEADQMIQAKNSIIQYTAYSTWLQENLGLSSVDANSVVAIRQQQIGKPDLYSSWLMARKGLIKDTDWYLKAKLGHGYTSEDAIALYQQFYYTFSPMELFRISDLMPTTTTWIDKKLKNLGLNDEDKTIMTSMISSRTTKDEVSQAWTILADNYSWGLQTTDDLTKFLTDNGVPDIQAKAKLIIANLLRAKVVLKLMRDAEIYLYRKNVLNENQLLTSLQDLNISLDVANAITRNEATKKGIDWEIPA